MRTYLLKASLFFAPLVILGALLVFTLWRLGEFTTNSTMLHYYKEGVDYRYGKNYVPSPRELRNEIIEQYPPEIIVLGDSRSFQVRREFFKDTYSFFCWSQIANVDDIRNYLRRFEEDATHAPKVIVLILDQHVMVHRGIADRRIVVGDGIGETRWLQVFSSMLRDIATGELPPTVLLEPKDQTTLRIGALSVVHHVGYRNDGSISYGDRIPGYEHPDHEDYQFRYYLRLTERGLNNMRQGDHPARESIDVMRDFYEEAARHNIHVVTILPPFAPTIYAAMQRPENHYGYITEVAPILANLSTDFGHTFFDFTDPATLALRDEDFFDGIHWSEVANAIALTAVSQSDARFAEYFDQETVQSRLKERDKDARYLFPI